MNLKKGFVIPLIIAIVAVLVIGGSYLGFKLQYFPPHPIDRGIISTITPIVGGDKDTHGCIGSAGYSWCEIKNKCLRVWEEKCEVVLTSTTIDEIKDWQTYKNEKYGFEIKYPTGWQTIDSSGSLPRISFGQIKNIGSLSYDGEWFVFVYSDSDLNIDNMRKSLGEETEKIYIDGVLALRFSNDNYESILIKNNNKNYWIHNGNVKNVSFTNFYKSFKFLPVISEKATGIIKSVYKKEGNNYLDIDYILMNSDWKPNGVSGSPYTNESSKIRTFEISSNVEITISDRNQKISFLDFSNCFIPTSQFNYMSLNPWSIEIENGIVVKIHELFLP